VGAMQLAGSSAARNCLLVPTEPLQAIYEWFDIGFDKFGRTPTRAQTQIGQASQPNPIVSREQDSCRCSQPVLTKFFCEHTCRQESRPSAAAARSCCMTSVSHRDQRSHPGLLGRLSSSRSLCPAGHLSHAAAAGLPGGADHGAVVLGAAGQVPGRPVSWLGTANTMLVLN